LSHQGWKLLSQSLIVLEERMNITGKLGKKGVLLTIVFLLPILAACSLIGGTFEVGIESDSPPEPSFFIMDQLRPIIDAILVGSLEDRIALVNYTTTPCSNAEGLGGPPKCEADETEGTLVKVLPVLSGEASYSRPDTIQNALDFNADALYAVYRVAEDAQGEDYWPAGEYGILFVGQEITAPLTIFVEDARIVRIHHHFGSVPEDLFEMVSPESVILSPEYAAQWIEENYSSKTLPTETTFIIEKLRPVIDAILVGSLEDRVALVSYTTTPCSNVEGLGGPPKCEVDETEGTLVEVLPVSSGEASYSRSDTIQNALDFSVEALYAVYRVAQGGQGEDYWPEGEYGILFVSQDFPTAFTIFVEDARIVRIDYHLGYSADQILETLPSESVILSPEFAAQWMSENYSPTAMPSESTTEAGIVSGRICYPSEFIPEMMVFFQESTTGDIIEFPILENQSTYSIVLTPGRYTAYAYLNSGASLGGAYTEMVLCGLSVECSDHTLVEFDVQSGETLDSIDICDWYAPESLPPDPRADEVPLAGMIYTTQGGEYYLIESNGNAQQLFDGMGLAIPYTGSYGVYFDNDDLHAIDLFEGGQFNLTNTPDLIETSYQFEVGLPEELLFTAIADTDIAGPGYTGGLYIIDMDGTDQRTIDSEHNAGYFSASPDGQSIAYGVGETAYLFTWETGVQTFDPRQYGMDSPRGMGIASPSWSPAGDKLAWFVSGFFGGQEDSQGFGIFDLQAKIFQLIHPHQMPAGDAIPPAAKWSPDGEWLAISTFDVDQTRNGVWLVNTLNPQQEFFMGSFSGSPVFGPWDKEKKILAYYRYDVSEEASQVWLYDLVSGDHRPASLPPNAQAVAWW
jgi:hypothetical protein